MVLDQAGWHGSKDLPIPVKITLVPLASCSPKLKPVERVWLYLKERFLSHRLLAHYDAIAGTACNAWKGSWRRQEGQNYYAPILGFQRLMLKLGGKGCDTLS
jgi:transposase